MIYSLPSSLLFSVFIMAFGNGLFGLLAFLFSNESSQIQLYALHQMSLRFLGDNFIQLYSCITLVIVLSFTLCYIPESPFFFCVTLKCSNDYSRRQRGSKNYRNFVFLVVPSQTPKSSETKDNGIYYGLHKMLMS